MRTHTSVSVPRVVWTRLKKAGKRRSITTVDALRCACELFVRQSERYQEFRRSRGGLPFVYGGHALVLRAAHKATPYVAQVPSSLWAAFKAETIAQGLVIATALDAAATLFERDTDEFLEFCAYAREWPEARHRGGKFRHASA